MIVNFNILMGYKYPQSDHLAINDAGDTMGGIYLFVRSFTHSSCWEEEGMKACGKESRLV